MTKQRQSIRSWDFAEMTSRPNTEVIAQSNLLTDAIRPILFGKHPSAQMLTLIELTTIWIRGHKGDEFEKEMLELFILVLREAVNKLPTTSAETREEHNG